jgi:hypothetical protein
MIELARKAVRRLYLSTVRKKLGTSVSDNQAYPHFCGVASREYRTFKTFRRHPIYNQILEHVTRDEGAKYLAEILPHRDICAHFDEFKRNDEFGGPRTFEYPSVGRISPTTLRYVKVLADLERHFGLLDGLRISEIGVGYGGQCRIICARFRPSAYRLVDIRPALSLAQRFLDQFALDATLTFQTMNELDVVESDLLISNYAFTELPRTIQEVYLRKLIRNSARGYITYNEITPDSFHSYAQRELVETIPGAHIIPEKPLTHPGNCIILWGDHSARGSVVP